MPELKGDDGECASNCVIPPFGPRSPATSEYAVEARLLPYKHSLCPEAAGSGPTPARRWETMALA